MKKVFVFGSINMDLVIETESLPKVGESVFGSNFMTNQGGKGANQAVASRKLGCETYFIGAVGNDSFGKELLESINSYGVNTDGVEIIDGMPSGSCMIITGKKEKDNMLVVNLGTNNYINPKKAISFLNEKASKGDIFITQLEGDVNTIEEVSHYAKEMGLYTVLNPAPAREISKSFISNFNLVIPNETEAEKITGVTINSDDDAKKAFGIFKSMGVKELIITLGGDGSVFVKDNYCEHFRSYSQEVVDTTSAGDTFIGALCSRLSDGMSIEESIPFASRCAAITVSRRGAAKSIPTLEEVKKLFNL